MTQMANGAARAGGWGEEWIPVADASAPVYRALAVILDSCKALDPLLAADGPETAGGDGCLPLLRLLDAADDLVQFVRPDPEPAAYHPAAPHMLPPVRTPLRFRHADRPEWDFGAWFGEKAATVKSAAKRLVKLWKTDAATGCEAAPHGGPVGERRRLALAAVAAYAQVIFDQVDDEALRIEATDEAG